MLYDFLFVLVVFFSNIIQSVTGFAGTLLAMPPAIHLIGISDAKVILNVVTIVGCIAILLKCYRAVDLAELKKIVFFMLLGMVLGIQLFRIFPLDILLLLYGVMIIVIAVRKLCGAKPIILNGPMRYLVLLSAGVIHGMFVSGGALLVVYASAAFPSKDAFRATLASVWIILNTVMFFGHASSGMFDIHTTILALTCVIPVLLSAKIGSYLHDRISQKVFFKITNILLLISGVSAVL